MKGQGFLRRFGYARSGIVAAFIFLAITDAPAMWWALIALAIGLVLVAEMANTALETLADRLHPGQHPEIGVAKDVAAGAVLVATLVAIGVGVAYLLR
jgi:diacylglycerol kinase (ATP)